MYGDWAGQLSLARSSLRAGWMAMRGEDKPMKNLCVRLFREEQGQDLIEYTLLLAFVCLAAAALFIPTGRTIASIFSITSKSLSQAASAASN
jgi:Flp pilus assembly pilin Flp